MVIMRHGSANRSNGSPLKLHTIRVDPKTSKTNASFSSMIKIKSHGIQAFLKLFKFFITSSSKNSMTNSIKPAKAQVCTYS